MADERKCCSNCIYFRSKNGMASLFNDYYCCNDANVQQTGFFNKEEVYLTIRRESVCNYFTSKDNGFRR